MLHCPLARIPQSHGRPFPLTLALSHEGRGDSWWLCDGLIKEEGFW